jgi:hypothetical protein
MSINKSVIIAALTLSVTIGAGAVAFASDHNSPSSHRTMKHGRAAAPDIIAFNRHGGGHEQAGSNAAVHAEEMKDTKHKDAAPQVSGASYVQHGGGHEQATDNDAVHAREISDPNHKD